MSEHAYSYELYKRAPKPLDFGFYTRYLQGPFTRVLEHVVSPKSLREAWKLRNYPELVASASAMGAPLLRYGFTIANPQTYNRRAPMPPKATDEADLDAPVKKLKTSDELVKKAPAKKAPVKKMTKKAEPASIPLARYGYARD